MDDVARWPAQDRADLFASAAGQIGLTALLVEKDFWVCWMLRRAYEATGRRLLFKGGTSLSKVHRAIRRFSEDVDLSFDRREFGFTGSRDPATPGLSGKKQKRLLDEMREVGKRFVQGDFRKAIEDRIAAAGLTGSCKLAMDPSDHDGQSLSFEYPGVLSAGTYAGTYVRPAVVLELGMRSHLDDAEPGAVEPFAAETHGAAFQQSRTRVLAQPLSRTFWEKVTALHEKAVGGFGDKDPKRFSRHHADVVALATGTSGDVFLAGVDLLVEVARHKAVFFRVGGAPYDTARPGTLRLRPLDADVTSLRRDYASMAEMFFDDPMPFDEMLRRLKELEERINGA